MKRNCYNCDINCLCPVIERIPEEAKEDEHDCFVEEPEIEHSFI